MKFNFKLLNAVTNENVETSAITGWSGTGADNWTGEEATEDIFDEGTGLGLGLSFLYSC